MGQHVSTDLRVACRRRLCPPAKRRRLLPEAGAEELKLWELIKSPGQLDNLVDQLGVGDTTLQEADVGLLLEGLEDMVGRSLEVDPEMLFARFDADCDGSLDPDEVKCLVRAVLFQHCKALGFATPDLDIPSKRLRSAYTISRKLGEGGQGAMYLAKCKRLKADRCVKFYQKGEQNAPTEDILFEFEVMKTLSSPYVARTYEIFQDGGYFCIVSEPYLGGDLTKLVAQAAQAGQKVDEQWLSRIFTQVLKGLAFLHHKKIIHCDLKESNVMVAEALKINWQNPQVLLIDFGLSSSFISAERGLWGTPGYIPPETFQSSFWVPKGDVFSAGVMFYQIVSGKRAPYCPARRETAQTSGGGWEEVEQCTLEKELPLEELFASSDFKDLLKQTTSKDFKQRPSASACLRHPWFQHAGAHGAHTVGVEALGRLRALQQRTAAQKAIFEKMLASCNLGQMRSLNDLFRSLDSDGDGVVTVQEARDGLRQIDLLGGETLTRLIDLLMGPDGTVEYSAFMAQMIGEQVLHEGVRLWDIFCELDIDGDGYLTREELPGLLAACKFDAMSADHLLRDLDSDGDGRVSFQEFEQACLAGIDEREVRKLKGWFWPW
ncbi:unnamed protein product [Effrenium voratum]|uniref:Uncharacterized protein n=1 Tax=Effrenium voratum TaxID=2562239 RepID=A0AA36J3N1_9DINO|nr:unnamed protein product [Effrenium voratum]CAJ1413755.1 unnamed protein product [Effrenium voratum]